MFSPTALGALLRSPMVLDPYYGPVTCQLILLALDEWERDHPGMLEAADSDDLGIVRTALKLYASIPPGTRRPSTSSMLSQSSNLPHHAISMVFRNGAAKAG